MKKQLMYLASASFFLLMACKQNAANKATESNDATAKMNTKEDSAYKATIAYHDAVMPLMGVIIGYEKKAMGLADSIKNVIETKRLKSEVLHDEMNKYSSLYVQLKTAETAMNDWMAQFNADPKMVTTEERTAYFDDQKLKAKQMKEQFFAAIEKAKSLLGE